jgi:tetratricopeptide (TPR) repeat protein
MAKKNHIVVFLIILIGLSSVFSCKVSRKVVLSAEPKIANTDTLEVKLSPESRKEFEYLFIEGLKQKSLGNIDEAIKLFSRCLEIDARSSATFYEMANIHVSKDDFQSSMFLLEKAVQLNPDNQYYRLLLVKVYQQNKLYEKAAEQYEALSKLVPSNPEFLFYQAALIAIAGKSDQALSFYNALEQKLGYSEPIALGREQVYLQMGNKPAAYGELEKLIKAYPTVSKYYGLLADLYLADKDRVKALENYNRVIQLDPNDGFVHLSLADFYLEANDSAKCFDHLNLAFLNGELDLEPKAQMYLGILKGGGSILSDSRQLELIHSLVKAHPKDERPLTFLVDYYQNKKQLEAARAQMRKILMFKKDHYPYWEHLLLFNNDLKDWKAINEESQQALSYFPEQPMIYILKSVGLIQQKKYTELLAVIDSGLVHVKNDPKILSQLYTYRAEAFYYLKRYNDAFDVFDKVVALDPDNYMALNNYAYYLSIRGERLAVAEKLSAKVVQNNPDNATYLDTYAWVFFMKKDFQLAKFYMEIALSKTSEDTAVLIEHYGDILYFLGDKSNALIQWKKSVEKGNKSKVLIQKIAQKRFIKTKED